MNDDRAHIANPEGMVTRLNHTLLSHRHTGEVDIVLSAETSWLHPGRVSRIEQSVFSVVILFEIQLQETGDTQIYGQVSPADIDLDDPRASLSNALDIHYPSRTLYDQVKLDFACTKTTLSFGSSDYLVDPFDFLMCFAFRNHYGCQSGENDRFQVLLLILAIDADLNVSTSFVDQWYDIFYHFSSRVLASECNGVLDIENDAVSSSRPRL